MKKEHSNKEKFFMLGIFVLAGVFTLFLLGVFSNPEVNENSTNPNLEDSIKCEASQRNAEACIMIYDPVCGYFNDGTKETYPNSCQACSDEKVDFYIRGEC